MNGEDQQFPRFEAPSYPTSGMLTTDLWSLGACLQKLVPGPMPSGHPLGRIRPERLRGPTGALMPRPMICLLITILPTRISCRISARLSRPLRHRGLIYDVGGGTGNYTEIAARACPGSEIRFVEPDLGMIGRARSKLSALRNIAYDPSPFESIDAPGTADLVICVHALYAMPQPEQRLIDMARLLRPGGWLYLIDLGRYLDVTEWRSYLFRQLRTKYGLARALRVAWQAREIAKQNRAILEAQKSGAYWTHSDTEMAAHATAAGLTIYRQQTVYPRLQRSSRLSCNRVRTMRPMRQSWWI
jgi:ubiquinone/menaquinone biosynthesis C-methylase UbiE